MKLVSEDLRRGLGIILEATCELARGSAGDQDSKVIFQRLNGLMCAVGFLHLSTKSDELVDPGENFQHEAMLWAREQLEGTRYAQFADEIISKPKFQQYIAERLSGPPAEDKE